MSQPLHPHHHEVERAYAAGPDDVLPDFAALPDVDAVTEPRTATLVATYVDTDDLSLVRAGVTLRRRTGGDDEGWHLKVPAGAGRDEVRLPLGVEGVVPATLAHTVLGWTRGRDLRPVATIETERTTRLLLAADGTVLAEVADDRVVGTPLAGGEPGEPTAWRELEVELVAAGTALLDHADELLAAASDIHPRTEQRKVGTVLATRLDEVRSLFAAGAPDDDTAGAVLHARLVEQVTALRARDCDVRRGVDDGVHQLRVACRRLRGALATYRPLVDRDVTDPVRDDLRWVARTLGDARDAEVARDRVLGLVDDLPPELVVGPVRRRVEEHYAARLAASGSVVQETLVSPRYLGLLAALDELVTAPPLTDRANDDAETVLDLVARDATRLRARVREARASGRSDDDGSDAPDLDHDEAWHDVRKAAKRLRYACEAVEPVWGKPARRLHKAAQEITRVLGDGQDAVVLRADLLELAAEATGARESAFTYGVLHAREESDATRREAELDHAWALLRRRRRAWL